MAVDERLVAFDLRLRLDMAGPGGSAMPFTPEAQRAQAAAVYDWFRRRFALIIVVIMLLLQFLTWRAVERVAQGLPRDPPRCSEYDPCNVSVRGSVSLDPDTVRRLQR
jgi:hypothetical protein